MLPLFKVELPANAGSFFKQMMMIAAFEIFDTKPMLDWLFRLSPSDPFNSNFEAVGFESVYLLHNLGTLAIIFAIYALASLVSYLARRSSYNSIRSWGFDLHESLHYGTFISMMFESYLILTVSCFINMKHLAFSGVSVSVMSLLTINSLLLLIAFPLGYSIFLIQNFETLDDPDMETPHGKFYEDLELENGMMVLAQPIWFLVRRIVIAVIVLFLNTAFIW